MDDIFEKLEGENAAIGVYYYGDYLTMKENNDVLAFALPLSLIHISNSRPL